MYLVRLVETRGFVDAVATLHIRCTRAPTAEPISVGEPPQGSRANLHRPLRYLVAMELNGLLQRFDLVLT